MADVNSYLNWAQDTDKLKAGAAAQTVANQQQAPDLVADNLRVATDFAKETGATPPPLFVVDKFKDRFVQMIDQKRAAKIMETSPKLAEWVAQQQNASIAADDIEHLSWFENYARSGRDVPATPENVNTDPSATMSTPAVVGHNVLEIVKGPPAGLVAGAGMMAEGIGQGFEIGANSQDPLRARREDLGQWIARARGADPAEIDAMNYAIGKYAVDYVKASAAAYDQVAGPADIPAMMERDRQLLVDRFQSTMRDVIAGDISPLEAYDKLQPELTSAADTVYGFLHSASKSTMEAAKSILPAERGFETSIGRQIGEGFGTLLALVGATATTGGAGGLGSAVTMQAGAGAQDAEASGATKEQQTTSAMWNAPVGALDMVPVERLFANPVVKKGLRYVAQSMGKQFLLEGGQEATQQYLSNLIAAWYYDPSRKPLTDVWDNFTAGGAVGMLVDAGRMLFPRFLGHQARAQSAVKTEAELLDLSANSRANKTRERSPSTFRDYLASVVEGGDKENVYLPAKVLAGYFQTQGLDPLDAVDQLHGVTRSDMEAALSLDGDVRIPTATYMASIASPEADVALGPHLKMNPDAMSGDEARTFEAHKADLLAQEEAEIESLRAEEEANRSYEQETFDRVVSNLRAAGRYTQVATNEGLLLTKMIMALSSRSTTLNVEELMRAGIPEVHGARPEGMQYNNVDELKRALAAARMAKDAGPQGPSLSEWVDHYGGIHDAGGELKAMGADVIKRPGKRSLTLARPDDLPGTDGRKHGADEVARAAIEAGYMSSHPVAQEYLAAMREGRQVPDITRALWDTLAAETRGTKDHPTPTAKEVMAAETAKLADIEAFLNEYGVNLDNTDGEIRAAIEGRQYAQSKGGAPRGLTSFLQDGRTVVQLFEGANLSTVLHEFGHIGLNLMQTLEQSGDVSAKAEMIEIRKWMVDNAAGVIADARKSAPDVQVSTDDVKTYLEKGTTGDAAKDAAIDTGTHEQFARGFEAYLMEGKAPSEGLRGAFRRFRQWLLYVYKSVAGLNVGITDEVRGVFDRMLATDEELKLARQSAGLSSPGLTAEQLGMGQEQFDRFMKAYEAAEADEEARVSAEIMKPILREREKEYKAEKAAVREEVTKDLQSQPIYRAIQEIRFGKDFSGNDVPAMKMDRTTIEAEHGAGYLPYLPGATKDGKGHKNAVFSNEGLHPDVVAEAYGFNSARQLLDAMVNQPPINEAIDAETARIMDQRHNDPFKDGSIQEEALNAIHGDRKGDWMAAELQAIADVVGLGKQPTRKQFAATAAETIGKTRVRDAIRTDRYLAAERKAGEEAGRLMGELARNSLWADAARRKAAREAKSIAGGEGNVDKIAPAIEAANLRALRQNETVQKLMNAKHRQLMNRALYSEAKKAADEVDAIKSRVAKLNKTIAKQTKGVELGHAMAARTVASLFGLAKPIDGFDFSAWMERLQNDDPAAYSVVASSQKTFLNGGRDYKDLTYDELTAVSDAISNLVETGRSLRKIEIEGKTMDRDEAVQDLLSAMLGRKAADNVALRRRLTAMEKMGKMATSMAASLVRAENWARDMDNGEIGPFTRYIVKPIMDAVDVYKTNKAIYLKELVGILEPRRADLLGGSIAAPELGAGVVFQNKGELLHAILHTGNESNLEKLLLGKKWSGGLVGQVQQTTPTGKLKFDRSGQPVMTRGRVDTSRWDAFFDRMIKEGVVTDADRQTANQIWKLMEKLKPGAQSTHKKLFGFYFHEIERKGYDSPVGRFDGGYVPAIADSDASNAGQLRQDKSSMDQQQTSFMLPTTGKGFTMTRVENSHEPLKLDIALLPAHMDKVLRFTHLEPAVRQTASIINNRAFRDRIDAVSPSAAAGILTPWLQRTAQQAVETAPLTDAGRQFAKILRGIRSRVGLHTMFANVVNTAQQIASLGTALVLVKPAAMRKSLIAFSMGGAGAMREAAATASPFMKARIEQNGIEMQRRIQDCIAKPTTLGSVQEFFARHGYFMQTAVQNVLDVITWHAAYDQAIAKGMTEGDATFEADSVIRRVVGDFSPENISAFETGNAFARLFTQFYSFFNGQANLVGGEMKTTMRTMGWSGSGRMFWVYVWGLAVPAIIGEAIVRAAKGTLFDDKDDDGYLDDIASLFFGSQARYLAAMVPGAGQLVTLTLNRLNDQFYDDKLTPSPSLSALEKASNAPISIGSALFGNGKASKAIGDGMSALGLILGIPLGQVSKGMTYAAKIGEGRSNPDGLVDVARGIVTGRDSSEK